MDVRLEDLNKIKTELDNIDKNKTHVKLTNKKMPCRGILSTTRQKTAATPRNVEKTLIFRIFILFVPTQHSIYL